MYTALFSECQGNIKQFPVTLHQQYSIYEFLEILKTMDLTEQVKLFYDIYDNSKILYRGLFETGKGNAENYFSYVQEEFERAFPKAVKEREAFMNELYNSFLNSQPKKEELKKTTNVAFLNNSNHLGEETLELSSAPSNVLDNHSTLSSQKKERRPFWKRGVFLVGILGVTASIGIFVGYHYLVSSEYKVQQVEQSATLDDLLVKQSYDEAVQKYPDKVNDIEYKVYQSFDIKALQEFNDKHPTANGVFDLAFLKRQWEKMTTLTDYDKTEERLFHLGMAYAALGKFKEAKQVSSTIENNTYLKTEILYSGIRYVKYYLKQGNFEKAKEANEQSNAQQQKLITDVEKLVSQIKQIDTKLTTASEEEKQALKSEKDKRQEALKKLLP